MNTSQCLFVWAFLQKRGGWLRRETLGRSNSYLTRNHVMGGCTNVCLAINHIALKGCCRYLLGRQRRHEDSLTMTQSYSIHML